MTQRNFNNSTATLGGTSQGKVTKIQLNANGAKIDVFEPGDLCKLYELGTKDYTVSLSLAGSTPPTLGATGALAITKGDSTTLTVPAVPFQCMSVTTSGSQDGKWEGTAEYAPTTGSLST